MASSNIVTPLQKAISHADDEKFRLGCSNQVYESCLKDCESFSKLFAYSVGDAGLQFLCKSGVFVSPIAPYNHTHPICKMLENHFLHFILPNYVNKGEEWLFSSMKINKWNDFARTHRKKGIHLLNRVMLKGDSVRYNSGNPISYVRGAHCYDYSFSFNGKSLNSTDAVGSFDSVSSNLVDGDFGAFSELCRLSGRKKFFFHDELHHWSENGMLGFLNHVNPELVCGSVVFPTEVMNGLDYSAFPTVYEFDIVSGDILFYPDGCRQEFWRQSVEGKWLFSRKRIFTKHGVYTISVSKSIAAHHMVVIEKGDLLTDKEIVMSGYEVIDPVCVSEFHFRELLRSVRYEFVFKLINYLLTLKKSDKESAVGKLRQLDKGCVGNIHETLLARELGDYVSKYGVAPLMEGSWSDEVKDWMTSFLPWRMRRAITPKYHAKVLLRFLRLLRPLRFVVKTSSFGSESMYHSSWEYVEQEIQFEKAEMTEELEKLFMLKKSSNGCEYEVAPFSALCGEKTEHYGFHSNEIGLFVYHHIGGIDCLENSDYFNRDDYLIRDFVPDYFDAGFGNRPLLTWYDMPICISDCELGHAEIAKRIDELAAIVPRSMFRPMVFNFVDGELIEDDFEDHEVDSESDRVVGCCSKIDEIDNRGIEQIDNVDSSVSVANAVQKVSKVPEEMKQIQKLDERDNNLIFELDHTFARDRYLSDINSLLKYYDGVFSCSLKKAGNSTDGRHNSSNDKNIECEEIFDEQVFPSEGSGVESSSESKEDDERSKSVSSSEPGSPVSLVNKEVESSFPSVEGVDFERKKISEAELIELHCVLKESKCKRLANRRAWFFCEQDWNYGHNGILYERNPMCETVRNWIGEGFNSALIQEYDENASLGMHKDDEECYTGDRIETINLSGSATLVLDGSRKCEHRIPLKPGDCFIMHDKFNSRKRHGVERCSEGRLSLTMRRQVFDCDAFGRKVVEPSGCFWVALSRSVNVPIEVLKKRLIGKVSESIFKREKLTRDDIEDVLCALQVRLMVKNNGRIQYWGSDFSSMTTKIMEANDHHIECTGVVGVHSANVFGSRKREVEKPSFKKRMKDVEYVNCNVFMADSSSAHILSSCLTNNSSGVISNHMLDRFVPLDEDVVDASCEMFSLWGFAGSGKSRRMKRIAQHRECGKVLVVSPRSKLAKDWSDVENVTCLTYELALSRNVSDYSMIVFDEVFLMPDGYVDLFLLKMVQSGLSLNKYVFVSLGDPLQASYFNRGDSMFLKPGGRLIHEGDSYLNYTWRCKKWLNNVFDTTVLTDEEFEMKKGVFPHLVPSFSDKERLNKKSLVMTYGESQGLTFQKCFIHVTEKTLKNDSERLIVALTRGIDAPHLVMEGVDERDLSDAEEDKFRILDSYIKKKQVAVGSLLGGSFRVVKSCKFYGSREGVCEQRLSGDLCQRAELNMFQRPDVQKEEKPFESITDKSKNARVKTNLPKAEVNLKMNQLTEKMRDRDDREKFVAKGTSFSGSLLVTDQFGSCKVSGDAVLDCYNANNVFPKHSHKDEATFWMGVSKRLKFCSYAQNVKEFRKARAIGKTIFRKFRSKLSGIPNFEKYMDECEDEFMEKKLEKNVHTLSNNATRSDPDKSMKEIFLFMKSQLCTKFDNMYMDAKAAQTLACFHHSVVNKFGVICRATEKALLDVLPRSWYVHSKKNFDKMEEFVIENFPKAKVSCYENDYTAFDRSQDAKILAFEVEFLKWVGWPIDLIEDYKELKFNLGCRLGNLAIMRFTGEFSTFFFNTLANMAFCCLQFVDPENYTMFFAGDDMCSFGNPTPSKSGMMILKQLSLKAKPLVSERPSFCGWFLTPYGLIKNPELVFFRLAAAMERKKIFDVLDSYTIELGYGYRKTELLHEVLSEEELKYQIAAMDIVMKHKDYLSEESLLSIWANPGKYYYQRRSKNNLQKLAERRRAELKEPTVELDYF